MGIINCNLFLRCLIPRCSALSHTQSIVSRLQIAIGNQARTHNVVIARCAREMTVAANVRNRYRRGRNFNNNNRQKLGAAHTRRIEK